MMTTKIQLCHPELWNPRYADASAPGHGPLGMSGVEYVGGSATGRVRVTFPGYTFSQDDFMAFAQDNWLTITMEETTVELDVTMDAPKGLAWLGGNTIVAGTGQARGQKQGYATGRVSWNHLDANYEPVTSVGEVRQKVTALASGRIDVEESTAQALRIVLTGYGSYGDATYQFADGSTANVDWLTSYSTGRFQPPVTTAGEEQATSSISKGLIGTLNAVQGPSGYSFVFVPGGRARARLHAPFAA